MEGSPGTTAFDCNWCKYGKLESDEKFGCHDYTIQTMQIDIEIAYSLWHGMNRVFF